MIVEDGSFVLFRLLVVDKTLTEKRWVIALYPLAKHVLGQPPYTLLSPSLEDALFSAQTADNHSSILVGACSDGSCTLQCNHKTGKGGDCFTPKERVTNKRTAEIALLLIFFFVGCLSVDCCTLYPQKKPLPSQVCTPNRTVLDKSIKTNTRRSYSSPSRPNTLSLFSF